MDEARRPGPWTRVHCCVPRRSDLRTCPSPSPGLILNPSPIAPEAPGLAQQSPALARVPRSGPGRQACRALLWLRPGGGRMVFVGESGRGSRLAALLVRRISPARPRHPPGCLPPRPCPSASSGSAATDTTEDSRRPRHPRRSCARDAGRPGHETRRRLMRPVVQAAMEPRGGAAPSRRAAAQIQPRTLIGVQRPCGPPAQWGGHEMCRQKRIRGGADDEDGGRARRPAASSAPASAVALASSITSSGRASQTAIFTISRRSGALSLR